MMPTQIKTSALSLYNKSPYKKSPYMRVVIEDDLDSTGDAFCTHIIKALQFWHREPRVVMYLCTGESPFIGYRKIGGDKLLKLRGLYNPAKFARIIRSYKRVGAVLDTWYNNQTQRFLKRWGVNPSIRPDMRKVIVFSVDAIFPQKEDDYFAFSYLLNNICDLWGIPNQNRNLFYGDIYVINKNGGWEVWQIPQKEYAEILENINKEGLKILEYQAARLLQGDKKGFALNLGLRVKKGRVFGIRPVKDKQGNFWPKEVEIKPLKPDHIQYRYLNSMCNQALMMHEKLVKLGGAHITLLGVGPSYKGEGHIGFCEKGTPRRQTCFIGSINDFDATFHIAGAHSKEFYGFKNMFVTVGRVRMPRFGFITYGPAELIPYAIRSKSLAQKSKSNIIIIATGSIKSSSVAKAIEGKPSIRYPLTLTQRCEGFYILDKTSARELRINRCPWEFQDLGKRYWTQRNIRMALIQMAEAYNCKTPHLKPSCVKIDRRVHSQKDILSQIQRNCKINLSHMGGLFERAKENINREILSNIIRPRQIREKFKEWGLREGSPVLLINPHMDDAFLALMYLIKEISPFYDLYACYTSWGYTAVYSDYILGLLEVAAKLDRKRIARLNPSVRETLLKELIELGAKGRRIFHLNYEVLEPMGQREKELRAQLLLIDLNERYDLGDNLQDKLCNRFRTRDSILKLRRFLSEVERRKPICGSQDIEIMRYLKTCARFIEAKSGLMYLGIPYKNILWPLNLSFYGITGRPLTIKRKDIDKIKSLVKKINPEMVIFNGEEFPDFGAHSNTEMGVFVALFELTKEGFLKKDLLLFQWAGVWDRIGLDKSQMSLILSRRELQEFLYAFNYFYPTQAPYAPILNASSNKPQSFAQDVIDNARESAKEAMRLLDLPLNIRKIIKKGGILNYTLRRLKALETKRKFLDKERELKLARLSIDSSSNIAITGEPPYPSSLRRLPLSLIRRGVELGMISSREKKLFGYADSFSLSCKELLKITKEFHKEMEEGLRGRRSSLEMLPTWVVTPTGRERGVFFALDLGGSNFRILLVNLPGRRKKPQVIAEIYSLKASDYEREKGRDYDYTQGRAEKLFEALAYYIKIFFIKHKKIIERLRGQKPYPLGFTFSFPITQLALNKARVKRMAKEFRISGLLNRDVVKLLKRAIRKVGLGDVFKVVSINNDTVGTLVAKRFHDPNCDIGGIVGTGTNFCYMESIKNIYTLGEDAKIRFGKESMVINIESGNFNKIFQNEYDMILDKNSLNKGEQILEKMVSGLYLGELVRLILLDLIKKGLLFKDRLTEKEVKAILERNSFKTAFMVGITEDRSRDLEGVATQLNLWGIQRRNSTQEDRRIVKDVCEVVAQRSARITASVIFAILKHIDERIERKHTVAIDGALFQRYSYFRTEMIRAIKELLWETFGEDSLKKVAIVSTSQGSGIGAAIISAMAVSKSN
jgi:hexokinase